MRIDLEAGGVNHVVADSAPVSGDNVGYKVGSSLWAHLTCNTDVDIYVWTAKGWVEQSLTGPNAVGYRSLLLVAVSASLVNLRANSLDTSGFSYGSHPS